MAIAAIAAIPPTLVALAALVTAWHTSSKVDKVHIDINSRMDQLLSEKGKASRAEGIAEGIQQNKEENLAEGNKLP